MALVLKDRVKESTLTSGTGTLTLAGASTGFQSFSVIGDGNTTYYAIYDSTTSDWEVGIGTYTASGTTLSRDTVLESSNSGSLVNFSGNQKDVFVTYPAEKSVIQDATGKVTFGDSVVIEGNLTVNGTTTTINAENLAVADNMIYLNDGSTGTNIDLGIAGNYNDGTYAHAGFFRDATDGRWKVYDSYTPEPDASPDIDTTHASFSLAPIQASTFYGALSGNASTATKLTTPRSIGLTGDVSGSANFDGSANISITATVADDSHNHIISNVDGLQTALDAKANLASPALTGVPTAPTAAVSTNTTQVATTAFVNAEIANDAPTKTGGGASGTWGISVTGSSGSTTGNAATASKLFTARTISLTGDVTGSASFDGSANASITATIADDSHNHVISNVDGLQTALDGKAPLTGTGASGTWGINISGNAATASSAGNADTTDGYHVSTTRNAANTIPVRDGSGYLQLGWINTTSGETTSTVTKIYASNDDYVRYITPATLRSQITDPYYPTKTGGGASGTWGISITGNADTVDGLHSTSFNAAVARYNSGGSSASGRLQIKLPFTTSSTKMLKFTVSLYSAYAQHTYEVSGYLYPSINNWYNPIAIYNGSGTPDIIFGREADGKAYISVANSNYTGAVVHSVTVGYNGSSADAVNTDWVITDTASAPNTVSASVSTVLNSSNYPSYSPTLTGGGASGTWGISISGTAAFATTAGSAPANGGTSSAVTINYNNDSNSTYQMLWGSGNNVYGTGGIYCNPSTDYLYASSFACGNWFRSSGQSGWYNESYAGGIYMIDSTWVRTYNGKSFYSSSELAAAGNITAYYSDMRFKTKTGKIENALDKVEKLEGFYYVENELAKSLGYNNDKQQVALSAQAVKDVMPEAVSLAPIDMETLEDGTIKSKSGEDYLTVDYARLVPLLVEAIKELKAEVKSLKGE